MKASKGPAPYIGLHHQLRWPEIDRLLQDLAGNLVWGAETGYIRPQAFLGVGGMKVFRDDIWGRLRTVFQADHRAYKQMGFYDSPQKDWEIRAVLAT